MCVKKIRQDINSNISAKNIFDEHFCKASKKFSQNFLFDEKINRKIVYMAGDLSGKTVVEIGPGPGGLTLEILRQHIQKLYIIEYDSHWVNVWQKISDQISRSLQVIKGDALKIDLKSLSPNIIISNLPYNISTQLLLRWLPEFDICERFVLMFQKEVADRICASPGAKSYGRLSILVQLKSVVTKCFDLEPGSFFPSPKVKSTVIKLDPIAKEKCLNRIKYQRLSDFLSSAFMNRRKIIIKSMEDFFENPSEVLLEFGYDKNTRAEQISVQNFKKIAEKYL